MPWPFARRGRARPGNEPVPDKWRRIAWRNVPYYRLLGEAEREALLDLAAIFIGKKPFEGCGGLEITEEVKVTIAVQACVPVLGRGGDPYPGLRTVLVYPRAFVSRRCSLLGGQAELEGPELRSGESWDKGVVLLSWEDVRAAALDRRRGHNVVLHELAHQLDDESGAADGVPRLPSRARYRAFTGVLEREYRALQDAVARAHPTVLDPYGAESPAEFFAVATECFFDKAAPLAARHPGLYAELRLLYGQDPAELLRARAPAPEG